MTPDRYKNAKYEDVPQEIRVLFENIPQSRRGMYIHGGVGTGKTHIAYALKRRWTIDPKIENGLYHTRTASIWNVTELLREIRLDYDRKTNKREIDQQLMEDRKLVFFDDIGAEKVTDWVAETLYLIINKRYNEMVPTIFTSNFPIQDLADKIGDRTVSRIVEMCDVVELVGLDRRITTRPRVRINQQMS